MIVSEALRLGDATLTESASPQLDSEVLLAFVLQKTRSYVLAHPEVSLSDAQTKQFIRFIEQRAKHIPVAYIINQKEFYGKNFYINEHVHIPRPATEDMITLLKKGVSDTFTGTIADIATGSGIIAITLAHELPQAQLIATDISSAALIVAQKNAIEQKVNTRISFMQGALLDPLKEKVDIIVSNLPYGWTEANHSFSEEWTSDEETLHQPSLVYDGGKDGLELLFRALDTLHQNLNIGGHAFFEYDPRQTKLLTAYCDEYEFAYTIQKDISGMDRILHVSR